MAKVLKRKARTAQYKIISLRKLSLESGVDYAKLYNNLSTRYGGMSQNEKTSLCNTLCEELNPFFDFLGFDMIITRKIEEAVNGEKVK
jgi:hypothetical protein